MLWSHSPRPPYQISNIIKINDSIQSTTGKYFSFIDLATVFCPVPISTASQLQFAFTPEGTQYIFSSLPMGHLSSFAIALSPYRQDLNYIHLPPGAHV